MSSSSAPLVLTDPTEAPTYGDGPLSRWSRAHLHDPRDEVFVRLGLKVSALMATGMAAMLFALRAEIPAWAKLAAVASYFTLWAWNVPPVILMLHCTMHRPFIRDPKWLNRVHTYAMSVFFGIPAGYAEHHMGMHHIEDNIGEDLSSTCRYRRDSFLHFLAYWARFFFLAVVELPLYLSRHGRSTMARRALFGELAHWALIGASLALDWRFGLMAFALPYFIVRTMMMVGNWGQHAFVNAARKNNGFSNSITCINSTYNQRAFNDGYHIGHHLKATRHWTEAPKEFLDNRAQYVENGAIVFEGVDFFMVSVLLWTGQWKFLAKRYVRLDGVERSDEEVIALLKSRVEPLAPAQIAFMQATA
ncbi:MAG: fatty acid desaturase [Myxococcales bacterium]|nr:fatty acid desaturase [Myxococcales bacterium]